MSSTADEGRDRKDILRCLAANASSWIYTTLDGVNRSGYGVQEKMPLRILRQGNDPGTPETYTIECTHATVYKKEQLEQTQRAMLEVTVAGPACDPAEEHVLLVVYAGTESELDVLADIGVTLNSWEFQQLGIGVHACWHAMTVSGAAFADIEKRVRRKHFDHIVLCGHSLGGALAQLAALSMFFVDEVHTQCGLSAGDAAQVKLLRRKISAAQVLLGELEGQAAEEVRVQLATDSERLAELRSAQAARVHCFTFGAPMPFAPLPNLSPVQTENFKKAKRWLIEHCETFVNNNDLVPRLPGEVNFALERLKCVGKLDVCVGLPVVKKAIYSIDCAVLGEHLKRQLALLEMYTHLSTVKFVGHSRSNQALSCTPESALQLREELRKRHDKDQRHRRGWLDFVEKSLADWYTDDLSTDRLDHVMDIYVEFVYKSQGATAHSQSTVWGLDLTARTNSELEDMLVPKPRRRRKSDLINEVQKQYIARSRSPRRAEASA